MAKKRIEIIKNSLEDILKDKLDITYTKEIQSRNLEEDVDDIIKNGLKKVFNAEYVVGKKTGKKKIDNKIPAYHGDVGNGHPDVMLFNYFGKDDISLIIENKNFTSMDNAIDQAICYAGINKDLSQPCRIVIGNSPSKKMKVRVLVKDKWEPLIINGIEIDYLFGNKIFNLIYEHPDINEFVLEEYIEKPFAQKDFHNIINKLKTLYRQIPEIQNNDDLSINFTVAFVALKMIMEKQKTSWEIITVPEDIEREINKISGDMAIEDLKEKYYDIFVMKNKEGVEIFNFYKILHSINARENTERVVKTDSILIKIKDELAVIPEKDLSIDLFGEVYECLANKKTKSALGEFFTRRHIIQPIVRMFLSETDIQDIVEHKKYIGDPCCGTGGFLTESFKYVKQYCEENHPGLDISKLASEIMIGYDINHNNIGRTRINMTLAGDGFSDIRRLNSLSSPQIKTGIDYILTNIPYGKGDYAISDANSNDEFLKSNNNKRLELNFILRIINMLKLGGKASIIVPEGILEAPTLSPLREYILKQCKISTIISLPKFAFAPYTKWKTYVIFIEKRNKPLSSIEDPKLKSESIYTYIIDNDGFANSDKRFPTNLVDEHNAYLHNELSTYIDDKGIKHLSKMEEIYELKLEDTIQISKNEWGKEIKGKKYGYIHMSEVLDKKTLKYKVLSAKEVNTRIKNEAIEHLILNDENYDTLISMISSTAKGYSVKKEHYIENDELKEEFVSIFEQLNIEYDAENNKYYDISIEEVTYALPLIPEKYLRKKKLETITLDQLSTFVSNIEKELKELFGGSTNENK